MLSAQCIVVCSLEMAPQDISASLLFALRCDNNVTDLVSLEDFQTLF